MSLLEEFRRLHPEHAPRIRFPTERGLEAYMEETLRTLVREAGGQLKLERRTDGTFGARIALGGRAWSAGSFSGWKAILKAYLDMKRDQSR